MPTRNVNQVNALKNVNVTKTNVQPSNQSLQPRDLKEQGAKTGNKK